MRNFATRIYTINDIVQWYRRGEIVLQPKFQRRQVWIEKARSFLIDTIIRGKPIPKFFMREIINIDGRTATREVVDGQQRLRSIFSFLDDELTIWERHHPDFGGMVFSQLPDETKKEFLKYELSVDMLSDASDQDVLDIFSRLNSYAVTLNQQELLHARYFGEFKQAVYEIALEFISFWSNNKIFSDRQLLRMNEAELTSELLVAMIAGIGSRTGLSKYYVKWDDNFPNRKRYTKQFARTMDTIGELMDGNLPTSNFRRIHVFYSLFCSIYHFLYGLPGSKSPRVEFKKSIFPKVRIALNKIDAIWDKKARGQKLGVKEDQFLTHTRRATTNLGARIFRSDYICKVIVKHVKELSN